jgi:hypothetical protein
MSIPRPQAYGACVVERAAQAHWRLPIRRPPGRWPGPAPGTAYGLCTPYLFGLVRLKQRRTGVPDREEQLGIGVAGAEPRTMLAHLPVGRLPGWSGQDFEQSGGVDACGEAEKSLRQFAGGFHGGVVADAVE